MEAATVGCALLAGSGNVYEGVCIHLPCGLGFCAEAAAIPAMLREGETKIVKIVAVTRDGILSPCGRCRDMMVQLSEANFNTDVILPHGKCRPLSELIPYHWMTS